MSGGELDILPTLYLRWTINTQRFKPGKPLQSSVFQFQGVEWSFNYWYLKHHHIIGLEKSVPGKCRNNFNILVQPEDSKKKQIFTDLSQERQFSPNQFTVETNWRIWYKTQRMVYKTIPEFGGNLEVQVVLKAEGYIPLADTKSTTTPTEVIGESGPAVSISVKTECHLPEASGLSTRTASASVQTEYHLLEAPGQSTRSASTSVQTTLLLNTPDCLESLSQDLSRMLDQGSDPDVEFRCGVYSTRAHGAVVSARSEVIRTMLASDMVEGRTKVITIPNMEPDVFQHFLRYIYTGTLPELTVDLALSLYESGDQYAVLGLAKRCSKYLLEHLSVQNACDVLVVADAHGNAEFKESVMDFMLVNSVPRMSDQWKDFCNGHPMLAIEVLNRSWRADT